MSVWPTDAELLEALAPWLGERRWFPLKGQEKLQPAQLQILANWELTETVRTLLLRVSRPADDASAVLLQVPLVLDEAEAVVRLSMPGEVPGNAGLPLADGRALVDGPHHPDFWRAWAAQAQAAGTVLGGGGDAIHQRAAQLRVITGEQSNTSVVFPAGAASQSELGSLIVKIFRVVSPGRNPDVEVPVALAQAGWERVPRPVAWSKLAWAQDGVELLADGGVAAEFVSDAQDGFELFVSLARRDDGPQGQVREQARSLASDLGQTTAQMHQYLTSSLGVSAPQAPAELAAALQTRAQWAQSEVPQLAERIPALADRLAAAYGQLHELAELPPASRVHGDFHLGQVLHAEAGWYALDFEGEPLRPLAQRVLPDQPLRDVAGMLRSFAYACAVGEAADASWLSAMRAAFLDGYAAQGLSLDSVRERILLTVLELDKALYEAVYEARNRPDWLHLPLSDIEKLLPAA